MAFKHAKDEEIKKLLAAKALEALPADKQPCRQTAMKMRSGLTWKKDEPQVRDPGLPGPDV